MLDEFFSPKSVAIVGASHTPGKVGHVIAENFNSGYTGKLFFVNPDPSPILGKQTFPSIKKIQDDLDLVVIAVRSTLVPKILRECVEKKVKAVVIISAGFSEIGKEGKVLEEKLRKIISKKNIRVMGPNVVGVFDSSSKVDTVFLPRSRLGRPGEGGIAFMSQSGAVGSTIMDWLSDERIGVSKFASYGNAMDVNEVDLLEYFGDDSKTKVIAVYMEGIKSDGRKFASALQKVSRKKPVVFLKAGKTKKGLTAVASHTGSLAGSAEIYSAVFKQFGATEALDWEELIDFSKAFSMQPLPKGNRLLVVTNGGGFGVLAADEAERQGLHLDDIPAEAVKKMREAMPGYASLHNPLDLTADSDTARYEKAVESSIAKYDGVVLITLFQVPALEEKVTDSIISMQKHGKPVLCCATGGGFTRGMAERLETHGVPVYPTPKRAVSAFAAMSRYATARKSSRGSV